MRVIRILVISSDMTIGHFLRDRLPESRFEVVVTEPGFAFVEIARVLRPAIAVIDRVYERPDAAQMEIAVLKDVSPEVRIIAISEEPSLRDARIVEQGIFYYSTGFSEEELVEIIEAAAKSLNNRKIQDRPYGYGPQRVS